MVDKAAGDAVTLAMWNSLKDNLNKGVMRPIASVEVTGSPAASITFGSIAADWVDLLVVTSRVTTSGASALVRFNGDSGANYHQVVTQVAATMTTGATPAATSVAVPARGHVLVHAYAGSAHKNVAFQGTEGTLFQSGGGVWLNTAPITSIDLVAFSTTWPVGTVAALYGISGV